ncbi:hypothetical protein T09_6409 [Trichinella sp. T9]|nr:hypothetical protein T09_6409 [Trichinella sp. T9]
MNFLAQSRLIDTGQRVLYSNIVTLPMNKEKLNAAPIQQSLLTKLYSFATKKESSSTVGKKYECHFCNSRKIEETTGDGRLSCNLFQFEKAWSSKIGPAKRCSLLSALLKRWMNYDVLKCDNCCFSSLLAESLLSDHFCRQASGSVINLN